MLPLPGGGSCVKVCWARCRDDFKKSCLRSGRDFFWGGHGTLVQRRWLEATVCAMPDGSRKRWEEWDDKQRRAGKVWEKALVRWVQERRKKEAGKGRGKGPVEVRLKDGSGTWWKFPWAVVREEVEAVEERVAVWVAGWEKAAGVTVKWADTWMKKEREKGKEKERDEDDFSVYVEVWEKGGYAHG